MPPVVVDEVLGPSRPAHLAPTAAPGRMEPHEKTRWYAAAQHAVIRYPGPVGGLVASEIRSWADFGYRLGGGSRMLAVVDDLLQPPGQP